MFTNTSRPGRFALIVAIAFAALISSAAAQRPDSPDWPCPQRKVAKLAASDLQWQGNPPPSDRSWREDVGVVGVVNTLANRRVAVPDAVAALKKFAEATPADQRNARLTLVFGGLLETVNDYRSSVISGIERFNRRQKSRAGEIEQEGQKLSELERASTKDERAKADYDKALELYDWNTRVFEERRQNLPLACEIPPTIDGRTFDLVKEIQGLMVQG